MLRSLQTNMAAHPNCLVIVGVIVNHFLTRAHVANGCRRIAAVTVMRVVEATPGAVRVDVRIPIFLQEFRIVVIQNSTWWSRPTRRPNVGKCGWFFTTAISQVVGWINYIFHLRVRCSRIWHRWLPTSAAELRTNLVACGSNVGLGNLVDKKRQSQKEMGKIGHDWQRCLTREKINDPVFTQVIAPTGIPWVNFRVVIPVVNLVKLKFMKQSKKVPTEEKNSER